MIELIVASDFVETAASLFVKAAPRTVALAGGETPAPVYARLGGLPYAWAATHIFFGDERCVPPDDPASNFGMADRELLAKVPAIVHRMDGEKCDAAGYERELTAVFGPGMPRFDLLFQGLGADGHTASLFSGDPALEERERFVVRVQRSDHARLTLTLPVLSAGKLALFLVAGESKREAVGRLLRGEDIPAARVQAARVVLVADAAAAGNYRSGSFP